MSSRRAGPLGSPVRMGLLGRRARLTRLLRWLLARLFRVPPELGTQRRQDLVGELAVVTRLEPLVERGRDDLGGNTEVDRRLHGPAALSGVRHPPAVGLERR